MKIIKKIDVWSLAKMQGAIAFAIGLILGLIQWLSLFLLGLSFGSSLELGGRLMPFGAGAFAGLGFIGFVFSAAFIGILGFCGGAITAWVYNFVAPRAGGGVRVELGEEE